MTKMPTTDDYSAHDCGGPEVCSGCSSWRHGVYSDGSGDPAAIAVMQHTTCECGHPRHMGRCGALKEVAHGGPRYCRCYGS
jgi:hypothetical protein